MVSCGGIYWIDLDKRRPCVVVSSSDVLSVDVCQAHVVPLTSNLDRAGLAGNVLLDAAVTGVWSAIRCESWAQQFAMASRAAQIC